MKKADRIFGLIGLGLSLWCYLESTRLTYKTEFTPGPGFMPFWVGVVLALLSCYLLFDSFIRKPSGKDDAKLLPATHALLRVGAILLSLVIATAVMSYLGFPLTLVLSHDGHSAVPGAIQHREECWLRDRLCSSDLVHLRIHPVHGLPQGLPGNLAKGRMITRWMSSLI